MKRLVNPVFWSKLQTLSEPRVRYSRGYQLEFLVCCAATSHLLETPDHSPRTRTASSPCLLPGSENSCLGSQDAVREMCFLLSLITSSRDSPYLKPKKRFFYFHLPYYFFKRLTIPKARETFFLLSLSLLFLQETHHT